MSAIQKIKENLQKKWMCSQEERLFQFRILIAKLTILNALVLCLFSWYLWEEHLTTEQDKEFAFILDNKINLKTYSEKLEYQAPWITMGNFFINFSNKGSHRLAKVDLVFELSNYQVEKEIKELKLNIRQFVIMTLARLSYSDFQTNSQKQAALDEIRDRINIFLKKGRVTEAFLKDLDYIKG